MLLPRSLTTRIPLRQASPILRILRLDRADQSLEQVNGQWDQPCIRRPIANLVRRPFSLDDLHDGLKWTEVEGFPFV